MIFSSLFWTLGILNNDIYLSFLYIEKKIMKNV